MTTVFSAHLPRTPVGRVRIWATERGIRRLDFGSGPDLVRPDERISGSPRPAHLVHALEALEGYFARSVRDVTVPFDLGPVTDFQQRVYDHLLGIPYGHVTTYGEVSHALGLGDAGARAVGQAVGSNPVAILIPCHRVVGSGHALHGFSGGLDRKAALLRLEGLVVDGEDASSRVRPELLTLDL